MRNDVLIRKARPMDNPPRPPAEPKRVLVPSSYFRWKGVLDRLASAILLAPGLPIIGFLVVLTRLTSRGPGIYRQLRTGKGGRTFMMYKIRTMRHDAEADTGPVWTQTHDPRITRSARSSANCTSTNSRSC